MATFLNLGNFLNPKVFDYYPKWSRKSLDVAVDDLFERNGKLKQQVWEGYFESYTKIVWNCRGYQEIIAKASSALPSTGTILDVGCGSGNFVIGLKLAEEARRFIGIDNSTKGLQLARARAKAELISFHGIQANLIDLKLENILPSKIQACIMNNVLYTIVKKTDKRHLLSEIFNALPQGGILVLNDPDKRVSEEKHMEAFINHVISDVRSKHGISDRELAVFAETNRRGLSKAILSSENGIEDMVKEIGFKLLHQDKTYYDYCNFFVLQKT